jgi:hypothetical protein
MTTFTAAGVFLLAGSMLLRAQAHVPERLSKASTAFLINDAGDPDRFGHLASELQKWRRFRLVDALDQADLIMSFGRNVGRPLSAGPEVFPLAGYSLTIRDRQTGVVLWNEDTKKIGAEKRLVEHLRASLHSLE